MAATRHEYQGFTKGQGALRYSPALADPGGKPPLSK
jgi:hypothetical protein